MIPILAALALIVLWVFSGLAVLRYVMRGERVVGAGLWLPLGFLLGLGTNTLLCSIFLAIAGTIPWIPVLLAQLALAIGGAIHQSRFPDRYPAIEGYEALDDDENANLFRLMVVMAIIFFATLYHNAITFPFTGYDGQAIWSFKAAILAREGTVYTPAFVDPNRVHYHRDYPLLVPMALASLYRLIGSIQEPAARVILATFFPMQVLLFFAVARRLGAKRMVALIATIPLFSLPWRNDFMERDGSVLGSGSIDLQLGFLAFASATSFLLYWKEGRRWQWWIGVVAGGVCMMTKSEGIVVVVCTTAANFAHAILAPGNRRRGPALGMALAAPVAAFAVALPWMIVKMGLPSFYTEDYGAQLNVSTIEGGLRRLPVIWQTLWADWMRVWKWSYIWLAYAVVLPVAVAGWFRRMDFFLDFCIVTWIAIYIFVYTISPLNLAFHLSTSSARLMSQMAPLVILRLMMFFVARSRMFLEEDRLANQVDGVDDRGSTGRA